MESLYTVQPVWDFSFDTWPNARVENKKGKNVQITKKMYDYYKRYYPSKFKFMSTSWEENTNIATAEFVKVVRNKKVFMKSLDKGFIDAEPWQIVKISQSEARSMERSYKLWFEFWKTEAEYLAQEWWKENKENAMSEELQELHATYETVLGKKVANRYKNDAEWIENKIVEATSDETELENTKEKGLEKDWEKAEEEQKESTTEENKEDEGILEEIEE